jgi:hypothetical protein
MKLFPKKALVVTVAALAGVMFCGATAFADTPAAGGSDAAKAQEIDRHTINLVNDTPYEWTLDPLTNFGGPQYHQWPQGALGPTQMLEPGRSEQIQTLMSAFLFSPIYVQYNFTDVNGGGHNVKFQTQSSAVNWGDSIVICAADGNDQQSVFSTVFNMVKLNTKDDPMTIAAGLNQPAELTVDATKEPVRAQAIMKEFADGTNKSYAPSSSGVSFTPASQATAEQVTGEFVNRTSEPATIHLTHSVETSQDTSLGAEIGFDAEFNVLGMVSADASVAVDTNHTFGTQNTTAGTTAIVLQPAGDTESNGWITRQTQDASVTGDFNFTNQLGIIYHVKNVTVSEQTIDDPNHKTNPDFIYGQQWTTDLPAIPAN